ITVSEFKDTLLQSDKRNERIAVAIPQTSHQRSFCDIHPDIQLFEIALHLVQYIWRNVSIFTSAAGKRQQSSDMTCYFHRQRTSRCRLNEIFFGLSQVIYGNTSVYF